MMMDMVEYCHLQCRWGKCMYFWMKNQNFCRKVFDNLPPAPPQTLFPSGMQSFVCFDFQSFASFLDLPLLSAPRACDFPPDGDERPLRGGSGESKAGESGSESGFYAYLWGLPVAVFVKYCCNGIRKETYRIYQRRDRRGLAAASLHPFGRLRPHASRSLQPAGAAVGETGKRRDDRIVAQVEKCPSGALSYRKA